MQNGRVKESLIVGVSFMDGPNSGVLIVGRQENNKQKIVNAFEGQEAWDLYQKLITKKKGLLIGATDDK